MVTINHEVMVVAERTRMDDSKLTRGTFYKVISLL